MTRTYDNQPKKKENLQNSWLFSAGWPQSKIERKWKEGRVDTIHTTALFRSARILWRFLETWVHLVDIRTSPNAEKLSSNNNNNNDNNYNNNNNNNKKKKKKKKKKYVCLHLVIHLYEFLSGPNIYLTYIWPADLTRTAITIPILDRPRGISNKRLNK